MTDDGASVAVYVRAYVQLQRSFKAEVYGFRQADQIIVKIEM